MKITLAHGSGGQATSELIEAIFTQEFSNPILNQLEDSSVVAGYHKIAMTTDSFVVTPIFFPGGDIGRLAVCGTVNDLLMSGATPKYLSCGFIIEEGADTETLQKIAHSMAETAKEAGVLIIAGDTKVIEGNGGIYINTTGIGFVETPLFISSSNCQEGDAVIVSGNLGDHHAAILSSRMSIENTICSDCAPLNDMVQNLLAAQIEVHAMRDITRGGLGTVLNEFAKSSHCQITLLQSALPTDSQVHAFCKILGLDPLYMGNEGKMMAIVPQSQAQEALRIIQNSRYGRNAAIIGSIAKSDQPLVVMQTAIGGQRVIPIMQGEGLPRIC